MKALRTAIAATAIVTTVAAGVVGGLWWWLNSKVANIPTFDDAARSAAPTERRPEHPAAAETPTTLTLPAAEGLSTYLVFGVGSQGVPTTDAARLRIGEDRLADTDGLTDTIMLIAADATAKRVLAMSLPRDTWLPERDMKLNAVYATDGPAAFAAAVTELTGIDVNHMVAVNFSAVADSVDALGGVNVRTGAAMRDTATGLDIGAGCVHLDGAAALAMTRSRSVEYHDGTRWRTDPTGDLGRITRTQQLVAATIADAGWGGLATALPALLDVAGDNMTRDAHLDTATLAGLARAFAGGATIEFWSPPAQPGRVGRASVVHWEPAAADVLAHIAGAVHAGALTGTETTGPADTNAGAATPEPGAAPPTTEPGGERPSPELLGTCDTHP